MNILCCLGGIRELHCFCTCVFFVERGSRERLVHRLTKKLGVVVERLTAVCVLGTSQTLNFRNPVNIFYRYENQVLVGAKLYSGNEASKKNKGYYGESHGREKDRKLLLELHGNMMRLADGKL